MLRLAFLFACLGVLALPAFAEPTATASIVAGQAWARATPPGAGVGAGYLTIDNRGPQPDRLLSVSSPVAKRVEIHEMSMQGGVMRMRKVDGGLPVEAGGKLVLAPRGKHLMFIQPTAPFVQGKSFEATLRFERAGELRVRFQIMSIGAKGPPAP